MTKSSKISEQTQTSTAPVAEMLITSLETLKVISDPLRLQLLELFSKPCTVKEAAKVLEVPSTKLYYHVGQLEEHKIIRVVDTRVVSGIIEKQYQITAKSFKIDRSLLSIGPGDNDGLLEVFRGLMDSVVLDIQQGIRSGLIEVGDQHPKHRRLMLGRTLFKMSPNQAEAFSEELSNLLKKYDYENKDPQAVPYSMLVAFHLHSSPKQQKPAKPRKRAKETQDA